MMMLVSILGFVNSHNLACSPASNVFPVVGNKFTILKKRPLFLGCKSSSAPDTDMITLDNPSCGVENRRWYFFSDAVMGGVSRGEVFVREVCGRKAVEMRGTVSLENNGGFIQIALDLNGTGIH